MLRTFSKLYGLPALRLGWAYAPENIIDVLTRIRSPFNVTTPAMKAGIAAMQDQHYVKYCAAENAVQRARLTEALTVFGLDVVPSQGNFILVHFTNAGKADAANQFLLRRNIIVRPTANYGLPDYLRITVGTDDENTALLAALREYVQ